MRQERPFSFHTIFQFCENSLSWPLWFDILISSLEPASSVKPYACQIILVSYGFACDKYDLNMLHPGQKVRRQLITVHQKILWHRHIMTLDINYFNLTLETLLVSLSVDLSFRFTEIFCLSSKLLVFVDKHRAACFFDYASSP